MAKKRSTQVLRLVSQAGTGFFYTIRKAVRANAEKCAPAAPLVRAHHRASDSPLLRSAAAQVAIDEARPARQRARPLQRREDQKVNMRRVWAA